MPYKGPFLGMFEPTLFPSLFSYHVHYFKPLVFRLCSIEAPNTERACLRIASTELMAEPTAGKLFWPMPKPTGISKKHKIRRISFAAVRNV
jgi:hypothetical protein